jgi:hypothetical protein
MQPWLKRSVIKTNQFINMKNHLKIAVLCLTLSMGLVACTEKVETPAPELTAAPTENFMARYAVPLTTGRHNGEEMIVDSANASLTNVAQLKPAIVQIVQAAVDGKINNYPDDDSIVEKDPMTFLQRVITKWDANGGLKFEAKDLGMAAEIVYDGKASGNHSVLTPKFIDLIWVDHTDIYPDRRMARIHMKDLGTYKVQANGVSVGLVEYLQARQFENYVINVETSRGVHYVKSFDESAQLQMMVDQGQIAEIEVK